MMTKESIEVIAQSIGLSTLSPDVSAALAPDVEYRVREVMQVPSSLHLVSNSPTGLSLIPLLISRICRKLSNACVMLAAPL